MREILFRGKRTDNGEWIEGYYAKQSNHACFAHELKYQHFIFKDVCLDFNLGGLQEFEIIPETVGQYTGLTDKNGKRIFEGDIFKFDDEVWESSYTSCGTEYDSFAVENYGVVGFDEDMARFDFIKYKFSENSVEADLHKNHTIDFSEFVCGLEVIGNIHDNPELLEGGGGNG